MPEVIKISDATDLVETATYPYAHWPFTHFNPIQSRLTEIYEGNSNIAIAASTSAGKTVACEMYLAYEARKRKGKGIYVGPLKALASEKQEDWSDPSHHFNVNGLKTAIVTGDFRYTSSRVDEVDQADLIVMTPEMLASRSRNHKSDKSKFLHQVGTVAFDESHLLTVPGRGDHIEVALMKLTDINPNIRIVLLSATMPNVYEICEWLSKITGRDTYYLESDYRPCPLTIHYETYFDGVKQYDAKEQEKVAQACRIVDDYPDDKFLIFVHTKRTGKLVLESLSRQGINAEFHNADLDHKSRTNLENKFKTDPKFRVIVATSTLAWGLNLPARRVIVVGIHRGLEVVPNYDIQQMIGRAGRPKYDPRGDAYILVPESDRSDCIVSLQKKTKIRSTLLNHEGKPDSPIYKTLAFHIVSEIHHGNVKTKEGFYEWFNRSLAKFQDHAFDDKVIDNTIKLLENHRAIVIENGEYKCTAVGKIASMFYYSPFDVADLRRNFKFLFDQKLDDNDYALAMTLANIDSFRWGIVNRYEKEQMGDFAGKISRMFGDSKFMPCCIKYGFAYFNMLKGRRNIEAFSSIQGALFADLDRTMQVINAIDSMASKWGKQDWFKTLRLRLHYGVEAELVSLCQIPHVGQVRAKRLKAQKIHTLEDFVNYTPDMLAKVMKCSVKLAEEALEEAKVIGLKT